MAFLPQADLPPHFQRHGRPLYSGRVRKHRPFAPFGYQNASFYQDRLGTNIGKALKKEWCFFRERKEWRPGEAFCFDDSYIHEAVHDGQDER
jgi:hypothetical protein